MIKRIVIKRSDGGVSIMEHLKDSLEDTVDKFAESLNLEGKSVISYREIDTVNLPIDTYFRDAWTDDYDSSTVDVDMAKARNIHMDNIRLARDEKLTELDKRKYGPEKDTERQLLRDLPAGIGLTAATTPEELKMIWPAELVTV